MRDVWVSGLSDRKCHEEVKMGSGQRTGLRVCLGPLIRACRVSQIFSGASHPALSIAAETAETFIGHTWCFSRTCRENRESKMVSRIAWNDVF